MAVVQNSKYCKTCQRVTLHQKEVFSGGMGCLLTILTGGLFIPFWLLASIFDGFSRMRCQVCGSIRGLGCMFVIVAVVVLAAVTKIFFSTSTPTTPTPPALVSPKPLITPPPASPVPTDTIPVRTTFPKPMTTPPPASTAGNPQARAVARFPELAVAGSQFNLAFLTRVKLYRQEKPEFFENTEWPIIVAEEVARDLRKP